MRNYDQRAAQVAGALQRCLSLGSGSPEKDAVWLAIREAVCTRGTAVVTPLGSAAAVLVNEDHTSVELLAAMTWLNGHEDEARRMTPLDLFVRLRGEATKGSNGSARAAQADALHGLTNVGPGSPVRFAELDAAS